MLPEPLGGGSIKLLTRGLEWVVLRLDAADPLDVHVVAKAADHETALELRALRSAGSSCSSRKNCRPRGGARWRNSAPCSRPRSSAISSRSRSRAR